ncbi:hypothetical protein Zm00014a_028897 [Zea mays]|uniref:Uncharacterized protein n=2 Tax=Zea mays TaxID=4577 RepID=A0A3L6DHT1_MAIZE|nr:hypothetical protein ZEAMMB73_Zm00001d046312 [Zea mays]PWZ08165.1 hypothetical protein Zm00014a_028897 [Zea mays]
MDVRSTPHRSCSSGSRAPCRPSSPWRSSLLGFKLLRALPSFGSRSFLCALLLLPDLALRSASSPWIPQSRPSTRSLSVRGAQLRSRLLHCVAALLKSVLVVVDWEQTRSCPYTFHRR